MLSWTSRAVQLGLVALALSPACKRDKPPEVDPTEQANPFKTAVKERLLPDGVILVEVDLNNDGNPEIWNYYRERENADRLLIRKEADLNRDGHPDSRSEYNDEGMLIREDMDQDFDQEWDHWDFYQDTNADGVPERVSSQRDTNNDQKPDVFTFYRDGKPTRKERDTNGDGEMDSWEKFDSEGNVVKSGRDSDYDGSIDERD